MKTRFTLLLLVLSFYPVIAQQKISIPDIRAQYESFEYRKVIAMADSALREPNNFAVPSAIDILLLKAQSHYALDEIVAARNCFVQIVKLDEEFKPDTAAISPKIIDLFYQVKAELSVQPITIVRKPPKVVEALPLSDNSKEIEQWDKYKTALIKSVIFPGWGHLSLFNDTKAWVITSTSAAMVSTLVYSIFWTNNRENKYLNASTPAAIQDNYRSYNAAYKVRNSLLVGFAALWLYTQYDILMIQQPVSGESAATVPVNQANLSLSTVTVSLKLRF